MDESSRASASSRPRMQQHTGASTLTVVLFSFVGVEFPVLLGLVSSSIVSVALCTDTSSAV